jgi:hypothetical protein
MALPVAPGLSGFSLVSETNISLKNSTSKVSGSSALDISRGAVN